jgi:hypothetical protein
MKQGPGETPAPVLFTIQLLHLGDEASLKPPTFSMSERPATCFVKWQK